MGFLSERERRDRVIAAARESLAKRGWTATTMAAIAEEAGISRALISYHFDRKDALMGEVFASIVQRMYEEGFPLVEQAAAREATATEGLRAYILANVGYLVAHPSYVRAASEIMANLRKEDGSLFFDGDAEEPVLERTMKVFERGQATGEFRDFDARWAAFTLRRAIDGAAGRYSADPSFDLAGYGQELADFFTNACLAR